MNQRIECPNCHKLISKSQFHFHLNSKTCKKNQTKLFEVSEEWEVSDNLYKCPICQKQFSKLGMVNHYYRKHTEEGIEFTKELVNTKFNSTGHIAWNRGLTNETNEKIKQISDNKQQKFISGELIPTFKGKHHSIETKLRMKNAALKSNHQRIMRKTVEYVKTDGTIIKLDSSWEVRLAKLLDEKGYNWIRPKPLKYVGKDNLEHNYFPDFYLPDYDIYFDPKNSIVCKKQKEKLDILLNIYNNIIILKSIEEIDSFEKVLYSRSSIGIRATDF